MSSGKKTRTRSKSLKNANSEDSITYLDVSDTESLNDMRNNEITEYNVLSYHNHHLNELVSFLDNPNLINSTGDPTTNIIDRFRGKCYNITGKKLIRFFKLLENCRRNPSIKIMFNEKQGEYSGIMLDFDIHQDTEEEQVDEECIYNLIMAILDILVDIVDFPTKTINTYVAIIRKPNIKYDEKRDVYKDGFHILIPGIMITRGLKRLLINKLLDYDEFYDAFANVDPSETLNESIKDFLDINSPHVPVFFLGNKSKTESPAYKLEYIFKCKIANDKKRRHVIKKCTEEWMSPNINLCYELSLNFEAPNGIIKHNSYDERAEYSAEVLKQIEYKEALDKDLIKNHGELSSLIIHDKEAEELKKYLDILKPFRYIEYVHWHRVLCALSNNTSYKSIAEAFSRKSDKFDYCVFDQLWESLIHSSKKDRITINSIYYWAKKDNYKSYESIRKSSATNILQNIALTNYKEGIISNYDIAKILHFLRKNKYFVDKQLGDKSYTWYEFIFEEDPHEPGEEFKYRILTGPPSSLSRYMSEVLPKLFDRIFNTIKQKIDTVEEENLIKFYSLVYKNFKASIRRLGDRNFKRNCLLESETLFEHIGFANKLDKDPLIRGVGNGILKLSTKSNGKPELIRGHHQYFVSKHTKVPYIAFNPYDEKTKDLLMVLRDIFPDDEPDSFEFMMSYLASTIDSNPKESIFVMAVGNGANGKSFLSEIHQAALGDWSVKMQLSYLISKQKNADSASPSIMQLKDATIAFYSESNRFDVLNDARVKEVTGMETLSGRHLHKNLVNFKPNCHHFVTTNNDFEIQSTDHGIWRRIVYLRMKIKFINTSVEKYTGEKNTRIANPAVTEVWENSPEMQGRYLGILVWYHYFLYRKYRGKVLNVPHPHIQADNERYRERQDMISRFLKERYVKCADETEEYRLSREIPKYTAWYYANNGAKLPSKGISEQFMNSRIRSHIKQGARGAYLVGHRFLSDSDDLDVGEKYAMTNIFDNEPPDDNFGIKKETSADYYKRICEEYEQYKHIFTSSEDNYSYDIDADLVRNEQTQDIERRNNIEHIERRNNIERAQNISTDTILPSGMVFGKLDESTDINNAVKIDETIGAIDANTDEFDLDGFLP